MKSRTNNVETLDKKAIKQFNEAKKILKKVSKSPREIIEHDKSLYFGPMGWIQILENNSIQVTFLECPDLEGGLFKCMYEINQVLKHLDLVAFQFEGAPITQEQMLAA